MKIQKVVRRNHQIFYYINLAPELTSILNSKIAIEFKGSSLKQDKATFAHKNVVNVFIVCELDTW